MRKAKRGSGSGATTSTTQRSPQASGVAARSARISECPPGHERPCPRLATRLFAPGRRACHRATMSVRSRAPPVPPPARITATIPTVGGSPRPHVEVLQQRGSGAAGDADTLAIVGGAVPGGRRCGAAAGRQSGGQRARRVGPRLTSCEPLLGRLAARNRWRFAARCMSSPEPRRDLCRALAGGVRTRTRPRRKGPRSAHDRQSPGRP